MTLRDLCERQRRLLDDANRLAPADADAFVASLTAHLRAWRPDAVAAGMSEGAPCLELQR